MEEIILRKAGDFPNKSVVEYATVVVKMRHGDIPVNLQLSHCHDDALVTLYLSPNVRLTAKEMYLDSEALAIGFKPHADKMLAKRRYATTTSIEIRTSTRKTLATAQREKHSIAVRKILEKM